VHGYATIVSPSTAVQSGTLISFWRKRSGRNLRGCLTIDVCAPTFIEKCLGHLEAGETSILCHAKTLSINGSGAVIGEKRIMVDALSDAAHKRFEIACSEDIPALTCGNKKDPVVWFVQRFGPGAPQGTHAVRAHEPRCGNIVFQAQA
jgi:hypothetical protein